MTKSALSLRASALYGGIGFVAGGLFGIVGMRSLLETAEARAAALPVPVSLAFFAIGGGVAGIVLALTRGIPAVPRARHYLRFVVAGLLGGLVVVLPDAVRESSGEPLAAGGFLGLCFGLALGLARVAYMEN